MSSACIVSINDTINGSDSDSIGGESFLRNARRATHRASSRNWQFPDNARIPNSETLVQEYATASNANRWLENVQVRNHQNEATKTEL
jgi:hypothetical protein